MSSRVELRGIGKRFGNVEALRDVDLAVEGGSIHAVVGENGAGKTTLMRILYGALQPDSGEILLGGEMRIFRRSADAIAAGIGMVSQHYSIIPELTCLENLMLGAEPGHAIHRRVAEKRADELASRMGFLFEWGEPASSLSPGAAQKLEILKLLWRRSRIMILDEPTAMLAPADSDELFASLKQLASEGATVILVTHRLPEVLEHCTRVAVLRAGRLVADSVVSETNSAELAELMIGHPLAAPIYLPKTPTGMPVQRALQVSNLVVRGRRGDEALKDVSLHVDRGEVVGVAGVDGSGQRELVHAIAGLVPIRAGSIVLIGEDISKAPTGRRLEVGLRIIPEDRHAEGIIEEWSIEENAALGYQRLKPFARGAWVDLEARRSAAAAITDRLGTKHGGLGERISDLSGGNQQRFVAARALYLDPKLILAFQPARGLDIHATLMLHGAIRAECAKGAGAMVVSFDLDELLDNCDRIIVLNLGRVFEPSPNHAKDRSAIGRLMVGAE